MTTQPGLYAAHINCFVRVQYAPCQTCGADAPKDKDHRHQDTNPSSVEHWLYLCSTCNLKA